MFPKKVIVTVGTRPEAIKMAPIILALQKDERFSCHVCATGQHQEMLYQVLDWFDIEPDSRFNVMTHGQPLCHMAGRLLANFHNIVENEKPDIVMVQGDTTSAFMASLAAYYNYDVHNHKPVEVAHVEAGLRTDSLFAPFPEEGNRRLVTPIADWHFAPTYNAAEALYEENITNHVHITGNTVIDALLETQKLLAQKPRNPFPNIPQDKRIILVTGHRRENYGVGFENICKALKTLAKKYPDSQLIYPVHLNPYVKEPVEKHLRNVPNIHLIPPMDYPDFVAAMMRSHIILTDSGGVQEEAPSLGKPVLVMRDVTERPEAISFGTAKLVGTDSAKIIHEASQLMDSETAYAQMANAVNPYGDGKATERILNLMAGECEKVNSFRVETRYSQLT